MGSTSKCQPHDTRHSNACTLSIWWLVAKEVFAVTPEKTLVQSWIDFNNKLQALRFVGRPDVA